MKEKDCSNCYWKLENDQKWCWYKENKPKNNICDLYNSKCECGDIATYRYKDKNYCAECLLKEFDVEENKIIEYYLDGEYLGNSDDINEVIDNLEDDDIEKIEDEEDYEEDEEE